MKYTLAAAAVTLAVLSVVSAKPMVERDDDSAEIDDAAVLNYALTLEHLENAFYKGGLDKFDNDAFVADGLPVWARGRFVQVAAHEQAHVDFLSAALGDKATKPCTYNFPYNTPSEFVALSMALEGVGVSAYSGAAQFISNKDYLTAAAVVLSTEARHASWVSSAVLKEEPWSSALDTPLGLNEVFTLASGFITSCPDTNPALRAKALAAITVTGEAKPGATITIKYDASEPSDIAVFLTGLDATITAPIEKDGSVVIPSQLQGTVYMVVKRGKDTVGGPAILGFHYNSKGELL